MTHALPGLDPAFDSSDFRAAERLVQALQFEGYLLYPYRPSVLKNQRRWLFGTLYPARVAGELGERSSAGFEVLVSAREPQFLVSLRVLRGGPADDLSKRGREPRWHHLGQQSLAFGPCRVLERHFSFPAAPGCEQIDGRVEVASEPVDHELFRVRFQIANETPWSVADRDAACRASLVSAHLIVNCKNGSFVPPTDPPNQWRVHSEACRQDGLYPALVGAPPSRQTLVGSPIIVGDYPVIASESPGDLFDMTEIDELLSLRILTLTPEEKAEMAACDPRARRLLERTEGLSEDQLLRLHGRTVQGDTLVHGRRFAPGDRVRIAPRSGGDVIDLALSGEPATICAVEQDLEGRWHFAVTIDADPGRDLGRRGLPGHRFFFSADELEPIA